MLVFPQLGFALGVLTYSCKGIGGLVSEVPRILPAPSRALSGPSAQFRNFRPRSEKVARNSSGGSFSRVSWAAFRFRVFPNSQRKARIRKAAHNTLENEPPELFRVTFSARRRKFRNCAGGAWGPAGAPAKSEELRTPSQQFFCKNK